MFPLNSTSSLTTRCLLTILSVSPTLLLAQDLPPLTVTSVLESAIENGDTHRGLLVFGSQKFACVSCHKIGDHGGRIGPTLDKIGLERKPQEIVESLLFPKKHVKPEYVSHLVATEDGQQYRGYFVSEADGILTLKEPSTGELLKVPVDSILARKEEGTLMPEGLVKAMSSQQLSDVVRLLLDFGHADRVDLAQVDLILEHAVSHAHGPAKFDYDRKPLRPNEWEFWEHPVNRDRIYDFYTKQAEHFRVTDKKATFISEFPGLDGGTLGHWGNQNEKTWADGRWNQTDLGSLQSGVFRGAGKQIVRGICVRLSDKYSACFDPATCTYPVVWKNGFVEFSAVRHGFMHGLKMQGQKVEVESPTPTNGERKYLGFYRDGEKVVFRYRMNGVDYLDAPQIVDGEFKPVISESTSHVQKNILKGGLSRWDQTIQTEISLNEGGAKTGPYLVDTIQPPFKNRWNSLMFFGGNAFLPDGSALLCTMQGDVWHVSNLTYPSKKAVWKRFASGLHQALGIYVDDDGIFVLGRDQITRLHDLNNDGEADYYECFSDVYKTSPAGHDYICGLERDSSGHFYTVSGNEGLLQISPDGQSYQVLATGFRNPDGLGLTSDGVVTIPCSEGSWTPSSMICAVPTERPLPKFGPQIGGHQPPFFGLGGPKKGIAPDLPMVYLPRGLDNSSGGQIHVDSEKWGPLQGKMLHLSFGTGTHFLLLRDEVNGQIQGGVIPLAGEFSSGVHRGRFSPVDGQLYVSGMSGWGSYTPEDGCFQRVRYTGHRVQLPIGFHAYQNGVKIEFTQPIDAQIAGNLKSHFAQAWNYRYSPGYGSPEFSTTHYGTPGHDGIQVTKAVVLQNGKSLFLEMPNLQPVNQLHLRTHVSNDHAHDLFLTIHVLDEPFQGHSAITAKSKEVEPHPILKDVLYASKSKPNRWTKPIANAREIVMETGTNLSFKTKSFKVKPGEPIKLSLINPDVVPHNWALVKPGTIHSVGDLSNRLIANPDAFISHYIPESNDVLFHTDVVQPKSRFAIYFNAPQEPGIYPYLCTFPGHWLVMNGQMIVE